MRTLLIFASLTVFFLSNAPADAQEAIAEDVIAQIEADGYTVTEVKRSWLGRIVITATNDANLREVVLNRTSGEVLRDQRFPDDNSKNDTSAPKSNSDSNRDRPDTSGEPGGKGGPGGPGGPGGG